MRRALMRMAAAAPSALGPLSGRILLNGGLRIFAALASLAFTVAAARLIGADEFGRYTSAVTVLGLASIGIAFGLPQLLEREIARARGGADEATLSAVLKLSLLSLLPLLLGVGVAWALGIPGWTAASLYLVAHVLSIWGASVHMGRERVTAAQFGTNAIRPVVALGAIYWMVGPFRDGHVAALHSQSLAAAASVAFFAAMAVGAGAAARRRAIRIASGACSGALLGRTARSAATLALAQLAVNATTQVDVLMLTWMMSPADVAHYYAGARAALTVLLFYGAAGAQATPTLSRAAAAGPDQVQRLASQFSASGALLTGAAAALAVLLSTSYLGLFGESYLEALPAMLVLTVSFGALSVFGPAQAVLIAFRRDGTILLATVLSLALNVVLSLALVPVLGILGAAIATSLQMAGYMGLQWLAAWRLCGVRSDVFHAGLRAGA